MNRVRYGTVGLTLAVLLIMLTGCGGEATQTPVETSMVVATSEPTATSAPTETATPTATSEPPRTLTVLSVEGTVQVRETPEADLVDASVGQTLTVGGELITGEGGHATIQMDDGATAIISESSSFVVQALEGTPENPITQFFLNIGEVFSFHGGELSGAASYEVETPNGVAGVRGTMMSVSYDPDTGQAVVTCLEGHCSLSGSGATVDLSEGEAAAIDGFDLPPGEAGPMTYIELQDWIVVVGGLDEEGIDIGEPTDVLLDSLNETLETLQVCTGEECFTGEDMEGTPECGEGEECLPEDITGDLESGLDCLQEGGEGCLEDLGGDLPPVDTGGWNPPGGGGGDGGGGIPWP
jgi:hypothetical protein